MLNNNNKEEKHKVTKSHCLLQGYLQLHLQKCFFKVERDEDILMWSGRQFHSYVAGGMKRREF